MTRRELYSRVAEILPQFGGAAEFLDTAAQRMRQLRNGDAPWHSLATFDSLLREDDALGQLYQAINAPALQAAYRASNRRKFHAHEIPHVTQLFTPRWVVEFLLHNTLGRLWKRMHPDTQLKWEWLGDDPTPDTIPAVSLADLKICDPACGAMNFGLVAVDMLRQMYREEFDRWPALSRFLPGQFDAAIVRQNLFGFDIDPILLDLARLTLEIKIAQPIPHHNLIRADALFDNFAPSAFDIIVTNPPYLSARNLDPSIVKQLKQRHPDAWRDFYACFLLQSLHLLRPGGAAGILCMHSFMFTAGFEKLRRRLTAQAHIQTAAHFGPGLFDIGNPGTLQTVALVFNRRPTPTQSTQEQIATQPTRLPRKAHGTAVGHSPHNHDNSAYTDLQSVPDQPAQFFRLVDAPDKQKALRDPSRKFSVPQADLHSSPRAAWMYWITPPLREIFSTHPKLRDIAPPRQGLATTDNARFVRYWWEVESPGHSVPRPRWLPYAKGGRFRRWFESPIHRVDWENDGQRIKESIIQRYPYLNGQWQWVAKNSTFYGRPGITYSYLTSSSFSARELAAGTLFDVAGSSLFPDDPLAILGILNSSIAAQLLSAINPTVNFQVGDLRELPLPKKIPDDLRHHVAAAIDCAKSLESFDETSPLFLRLAPSLDAIHSLTSKLADIQTHVDRLTAAAYNLPAPLSPQTSIDPDLPRDLLRRWINFALGIWLGRWTTHRQKRIAILRPLDPDLHDHIRRTVPPGLRESLADLPQFLARDFLPWHNRLYKFRPIFWGFSQNQRLAVALHDDLPTLDAALRHIGRALPDDFTLDSHAGIPANLAPFAPYLADAHLRRRLKKKNSLATDEHR